MATLYNQITYKSQTLIVRVSDGARISDDPSSPDRIEYNAWLAKGNTPTVVNIGEPTLDDIYDQLLATNRLLKAILNALNDGTLTVGGNKTALQLKNIIKAKL